MKKDSEKSFGIGRIEDEECFRKGMLLRDFFSLENDE